MYAVTKIETVCPFCGETCEVEAPTEGYIRWIGGELIQNVLPSLSPSEREKLMTGICDKCWEETFKDT